MRRHRSMFVAACIFATGVLSPLLPADSVTEVDLSALTGSEFTLSFHEGGVDAFVVKGGGIVLYDYPFFIQHMLGGCSDLAAPFPTTRPVWQMQGETQNGIGVDGSAWLEVSTTAGGHLTLVEVEGISGDNNGASFIAGFREDSAEGAYESGTFYDYISPSGCDSHPIVPPSGKEVRSIRLERTRNFAGIQTNTLPGMVNIKKLQITVSYLPTSLSKISPSALEVVVSPESVRLSEACRIEIYSLSGVRLKMEEDASWLSIGELPAGIYLVHATSGGKSRVVRFLK